MTVIGPGNPLSLQSHGRYGAAVLAPDKMVICHCRQVPYSAVEAAIAGGARSLSDIQRRTSACTRCFGCRFELEKLMREHLSDAYVESEFVTRGIPGDPNARGSRFRLFRRRAKALPRRMYMPALVDYRDMRVDTRVVVFNWDVDGAEPVAVRADLLALEGRRCAVRHASIAPGSSFVIDLREMADGDRLSDGAGIVKLVVDAEALGSLRPYFQIVSEGGISSTHEKAGPAHPREFTLRPFFWSFPIGFSHVPQEAYFFLVNTQERPMRSQHLVWRPLAGEEISIPLDQTGLDQGAFVPLHDHIPAILQGSVAGTVRLTPAHHKIAGFMLRYDREGDRWRVQHL